MNERRGAATLMGKPLTLLGPELSEGAAAPDFTVLANDFSEVTLATDRGKVRLILSLPSLDTAVCDAETQRFDVQAANFPEDVVVYAISCDLPFALQRWCGATQVKHVRTLSDHRELSFGRAYGTWIKELRQLSRAVFLVDADDTIRYVEYVKEIGDHPDYDAAAEAVRRLCGA